jgi:hypothetical protein
MKKVFKNNDLQIYAETLKKLYKFYADFPLFSLIPIT